MTKEQDDETVDAFVVGNMEEAAARMRSFAAMHMRHAIPGAATGMAFCADQFVACACIFEDAAVKWKRQRVAENEKT